MRFALIDGAKAEFPVHRLCRVLGVSQSGYFVWRGRPACRRQRDDMVLLAHVRSDFALSNGTGGIKRSSQHLDEGVAMGTRKRRSDRAGRGVLRSPGRPGVARREDRRRFWAAIAAGLASEDAACRAGVSPAVGTRWFREAGGMPPAALAPSS